MTSSALILTAGKSSRMGQPKALLKTPSEKSFIGHLIETYNQFSITPIIVTNDMMVQPITSVLSSQYSYQIALNNNSKSHMIDSIRIGLQSIDSTQAVFIHPVDCPYITLNLLQALMQTLQTKQQSIIIPSHKGLQGHPILIPHLFFKDIHDRVADFGLDHLVKHHHHHCTLLEWPHNGILFNINMPQDYEACIKTYDAW